MQSRNNNIELSTQSPSVKWLNKVRELGSCNNNMPEIVQNAIHPFSLHLYEHLALKVLTLLSLVASFYIQSRLFRVR